jgi:hypothetical protein
MPSYLDFNSTKKFRDYILGKTLNVPNGPQTFSNTSFSVDKLSDMSNKDAGDVVLNDSTSRKVQVDNISNLNVNQPSDNYLIVEDLNTFLIQRRSNGLNLYPYFPTNTPTYNLVGIMGSSKYDNESELFKFAANNIKNNPDGPVLSRISRNIDTATNGRLRLLDALNGNTATAFNIVTGREPLVDPNNKITVARTLPGKAIDFLQTVSGTQLPFSEIPGDYLSNPANPINIRPQARTEIGKLYQDVTGVLGSLIGIKRRPRLSRKPSDLLIEYMGDGQKNRLFDTLTFNKYAPNYTTTARSQNTSKLFNFIDKAAQGVKNILGVEAPAGKAYIGDDRGEDVKYAMGDFNDRPVRSPYYLSLMFDKVSAELFHRSKNITEGGKITGNLTWISRNSKNKLGSGNKEWGSESSTFDDSKSTAFNFREDSILGSTQEILNSMPSDGGSISHVGNVIDQTSRVFGEGDLRISKGSAIKYTNKFSGEESGVEYCRVWTKDRSYMNYSDTMKRTGNVRKFDGSVMGGGSKPWNLNYAPMSNGNKSFEGSTNIVDKYPYGGGFYAKKYMFSIENLAWKTSNRDGFKVTDLPACERGNNGGRVMWFPPYDLKMNEQNSARWEENSFLGRPEPIYTYQNTSRSGTISFKVVVDHPSILNLLVREHFKGMSDEEADNYINAFFAGCEEIDFYSLIQTYTTLDSDDINLIKLYLNSSKPPQEIKKYKYTTTPVTFEKPDKGQNGGKDTTIQFDKRFYFENDYPLIENGIKNITTKNYKLYYDQYFANKNGHINGLGDDLNELFAISGTTSGKKDLNVIFGKEDPTSNNTISVADLIIKEKDKINVAFNELQSGYTEYNTKITALKNDLSGKTVQEVTFLVSTSTSEVADNTYNFYLGVRRGYAIFKDIFDSISNNGIKPDLTKNWFSIDTLKKFEKIGTGQLTKEFTFKDFGYEGEGKIKFIFSTNGEDSSVKNNGGKENLNCNQVITTTKGLKKTAPIAFYCRQARVKFEYKKKPEQPQEIVVPNIPVPITTIEQDGTTVVPNRKPTIDVMKRIIMKTLSECHYFKKLEEDSPVAFTSLKEKLKYFHPGFHSTTPEGLNSRLTFLLQCVRPGDTIPIKGVSDPLDVGARNTSFGPPPICVLRIGDFYHSKVVIRDVGITYEDSTWDLNPEGIGVQPMIANVSLQVSFIGGQGLEKPVDRLQNALSSNFFANTEMYDERAISTTTKIDGQDAEKFTKDFLEKLQQKDGFSLESKNDSANSNKTVEGTYIGTPNGNKMKYTNTINMVYSSIGNYFNTYQTAYNEVLKNFGPKIGQMFLSPNFRTITGYTINTNTTTTEDIKLLGEYKSSLDLNKLKIRLSNSLVNYVSNTADLSSVLGFSDVLPTSLVSNSNDLLKPYIKKLISDKIQKISDFKEMKKVEDVRKEVIESLDKVNFITKYERDGKIEKGNYSGATFSVGFTNEGFYSNYSSVITYIKNNFQYFTEDFTTTLDYSALSPQDMNDMLSVLLKDEKKGILDLYNVDTVNFTDNIKTKLEKKFDNFITKPTEKKFKLDKFPIKKNDKEIEFDVVTGDLTTEAKTDLKKIFNTKNKIGEKLNFYKP